MVALLQKYRVEALLVLGGLAVLICFGIAQQLLLSGDVLHLNFENGLGVPLDDVYIHCRYASNLLHGFSYSFNAGETLTADTSPLWVMLIALGGVFTNRLEFVAITFSILSYLILAPGVYRASRDVFGLPEFHARIAGVATLLASRLAWSGMSGMETALAALLMLLVVEEHVRSRTRGLLRVREAIWLGLGLLVRPEFALVGFILIVDWIVARVQKKVDTSAYGTELFTLAAIASPAFFRRLVSAWPTIRPSQSSMRS